MLKKKLLSQKLRITLKEKRKDKISDSIFGCLVSDLIDVNLSNNIDLSPVDLSPMNLLPVNLSPVNLVNDSLVDSDLMNGKRLCSLILSCWLSIMLFICSGCNPYVPHMGSNLPYYGDNDYQKGFEDGCAAFTIFASKGFTRFIPIGKYINGWKLTGKHPDIKDSKLYLAGFNEGRSHCTFNLDASVL